MTSEPGSSRPKGACAGQLQVVAETLVYSSGYSGWNNKVVPVNDFVVRFL